MACETGIRRFFDFKETMEAVLYAEAKEGVECRGGTYLDLEDYDIEETDDGAYIVATFRHMFSNNDWVPYHVSMPMEELIEKMEGRDG